MIRSDAIPARQCGFSLLELAVAMTIVALLLGGMLMPLAAQKDMRTRQDTDRALVEIRDALIGFAVVNGRLPCPGVATMISGSSGAGMEVQTGRTCTCASAASDVASLTGVSCETASVAGVLPWATLGLPEVDAWGRRYTYRITAKFGRVPAQTEFGCPTGPVSLPLLAGFALCTPAAITISSSADSGTPLVSNGVPAVVVSHGKNGYGAYTPQGSQIATTAADADERENADGDADYVSNVAIDDQLIWIPVPVLMNRMVAAGMLP